jgi:hypothetical protein
MIDPITNVLKTIFTVITSSTQLVRSFSKSKKNKIGKDLAKMLFKIKEMKRNACEIQSILKGNDPRIEEGGIRDEQSTYKHLEKLIMAQSGVIYSFYNLLWGTEAGKTIELFIPEIFDDLWKLFNGREGILVALLPQSVSMSPFHSNPSTKSVSLMIKLDKNAEMHKTDQIWIPYAKAHQKWGGWKEDLIKKYNFDKCKYQHFSIDLYENKKNWLLLAQQLGTIISELDEVEKQLKNFVIKNFDINEIF